MVYDFIVVGSGIAGLSFALKAANHGRVLVITKKLSWAGSTSRAQGGIASVLDPSDSFERHYFDTLQAGAGLCRKKNVKMLVAKGPQAIMELVDWGVKFTQAKEKDGEASYIPFHLAREGGHSFSRVVHAADLTGHEIQRALLEAVEQNSAITVRENYMAIDLITQKHMVHPNSGSSNKCHGVYALDVKAGKVETFLGASVVLCTGGVGQVYNHTTNDSVSTGDGVAMAYRAGVAVEDMEFMQFHPTSFYNPGQPTYLISEALRGYGGKLRDEKGRDFMKSQHPMGSLAPRDIVARAIDIEMKRSGHPFVYLDMTSFPKEKLEKRFPNIFLHCREWGIKLESDLIPVVPAAHFMCGGIKVNFDSKTTLNGLYAVGETACTGVHGANRLASNSLLEAVVFADRALAHILKNSPSRPVPGEIKNWSSVDFVPVPETVVYSHSFETVRSTMWHYVGIVRSDYRLKRALEFIQVISRQILQDYWSYTMDTNLIELRNLTLNSELIIRSAMKRKESRGLHFNIDHPQTDEKPKHYSLRKRN